MTHSHNRTLLQQLGFQDPDRESPLHDEACISIAADPIRIIKSAISRIDILDHVVSLEHPISKGDGQYRSIIGFVDAMIEFRSTQMMEYCACRDTPMYREYTFGVIRVVWSLDPADVKYISLMKSQRYVLLVGATLDAIQPNR